MKTILSMFLLLPALTVFAGGIGSSTFTVLDVCYIDIHGKTNINSFKFYLGHAPESHTGAGSPTRCGIIQDTRLRIPVKRLQTDNVYMYTDFLALLKEREYPEITISFEEAFVQGIGLDTQGVSPVVSITIAGVTNRYTISGSLADFAQEVFLEGAVQIRLTDFDLAPPSKMFGLVKVRNEIDIYFCILLGDEPERR